MRSYFDDLLLFSEFLKIGGLAKTFTFLTILKCLIVR